MAYRLVVTDIDGTLLNEVGETTERVRATLGELERRGTPVVLATARPPRLVHALYNDLGLTGPVIAYNGSMALEPRTGRILFSHTLPIPLAQQVVATLRAVAPDLMIGLELEDEWHVDFITPSLRALLDSGRYGEPPIAGPVEEALATTARGVSKFYFTAPPAVRAAFEERLEQQGIREQVFVTSSHTNFVEVLAGGVNKGSALRALAAILGVPREAIIYLGDAEADMPALAEAGLGVAMGNAPDRVKAVAGSITRSNSEDGWVEAIAAHVLVS